MGDDSEKLQRETLADRAALEQIAGRSVALGPWPVDALALGTRVGVAQDPELGGPWAREFLGVIDDTGLHELIMHQMAQAGEFSYFVRFDEGEFDAGGDGAISEGEDLGSISSPSRRLIEFTCDTETLNASGAGSVIARVWPQPAQERQRSAPGSGR